MNDTPQNPIRVGIIIGSTRPGRNAEAVVRISE